MGHLGIRRLRAGDPDAHAAVDAVRAACVAAGEDDPLDEATDLAWRHGGLEAADVHLASLTADTSGGPGGFALVSGDEVVVAVAPAVRGAGLGTARAALAAPEAGPGAGAWSHGHHPAAARLAARVGWRPVRSLWVMRRALDGGPDGGPDALPPLPARDDVVLARLADHDDAPDLLEQDVAEVLAVNARAFAHHPEQGDLDRAGFDERRAEPWFDPADLLLVRRRAATGRGELLAFHWTKRHDEDHGEVYVVGVDPSAQGLGLGRFATLAGLHHLRARGVRRVHLYVEADNAAALHTYTRLGFAHADADTHTRFAPRATHTGAEAGR
ncbi:mycothiol synthase [Nocardioides sp.]|uniref:mycothiol synthase n=1 Tax=Nocardioides sp. TaxID=35761 RepID=UPI003517AB3E